MVRDSITRAAVPGVTIETTGPDTARATVTDAKGEFRFDHLTPAVYRLKYTLAGFLGSDAKGTAVIALQKGGASERVALEVTPFARLEGVVLGEEGRPLEGVNVYTDFNLQATTDADGRYAIERLQPGRYQIMLRAPFENRRATVKRNAETGEVFGYAEVEFYPGVAERQACNARNCQRRTPTCAASTSACAASAWSNSAAVSWNVPAANRCPRARAWNSRAPTPRSHSATTAVFASSSSSQAITTFSSIARTTAKRCLTSPPA